MVYKNYVLVAGFCSPCYFIWIDCTPGGLQARKIFNFCYCIIIGMVAGIIVAEYIRRKIGLETFFVRIYGPNEMDKKAKD